MAHATADWCQACGQRLPASTGRGRRRRYCDATCRSRARRDRAPYRPDCETRYGHLRCAAPATGVVAREDAPYYAAVVPVCDTCRPAVLAWCAASGRAVEWLPLDDTTGAVLRAVAGAATE
ncbi:MAG: hypothetical protein GEU83_14520 [Pseudonocardiaceae bacterium]|nr:hypothetical protein [Pseudonocardiaceae bacterium]